MPPRTARTKKSISLATAASLCLGVGLAGALPAAAAELGDEPYRPGIHFTPEKNWMNDPNGMVYYKGVYHLFFQHNPQGNVWGNMSWGHATSKDLVHWEQQPLAIAGDAEEDIFSGSVVVDTNNTSGLGTTKNPPLIAIYTSAYKEGSEYAGLQAQSLAYSLDDGQTWTKYKNNPVLNRNSANFRDPKVFWYSGDDGRGYWVMTAVEAADHKAVLYKSKDLKDWTKLSEFGPANATGGIWECPDLFPLAVDGDPENVKWVMVINMNPGGVSGGSAGQYFVGDFDGTTFTSETTKPAPTMPEGKLLAGFNDGTYNGWTVTNDPASAEGGPFGAKPAGGTIPGQQKVTGYQGAGLVNSFLGFDQPTGTMLSDPFTVEQDYLNFLVGGGKHPRVSDKRDNKAPAGELLFDGFEVPESSDLSDYGWTGTGSLVPENLPFAGGGNMAIGSHVINTYEVGASGDDQMGTATSPEFAITKKRIGMLIGGGHRRNDPSQKLEVQLLVNGAVVESLAGDNAGAMNWKSFDTEAYIGQNARIRVVDQATGGWGHLTLDHIVQTDEEVVPRSDETTVNLVVDHQTVRTITGSNSESLDFASWNVKEFAGKQAQIEIVDNNREGWGHILADEFTQSDTAAQSSLESYDWLDYGRDYYASVSFANMPQDQRIMLGWMNNWDYANDIPTSPWRSAMSLPRKVELTQTAQGPRLTQAPVEQVGMLGGKPQYMEHNKSITEGTRTLPQAASGSIARVDLVLDPGTAKTSGITVHGDATSSTVIGYDAESKKAYVDRRNSGNTGFHPGFASVEQMPVKLNSNGEVVLRVYLDRSSVEVFAQDGQRTLTDQVFPNQGADRLGVFAHGGTAKLKSLKVTELEPSMFTSATR